MAKGNFIKNSFIYTIGDMLPKVITFFMIPIVIKYLNTEDYGRVNIVITSMGLFSMFYILGMDGSVSRFYYKYKKEGKDKSFLGTVWLFLFLYNLSITLLLLYFGKTINSLVFKDVPFNPFFKLMIINCFLVTFTTLPMLLFRLKEQSLKFGLFNILNTIVYVCLIFYFVSYTKQGAEGNIKAYVYTNLLFALIYFALTIKDLSYKFSLNKLKESLLYGIPLIPHAIGGWILMMSDRWFLERYRTNAEIGVYALAYQFGILIYYLISAINKAYVPFFFKTAEEDKNATDIFSNILKYYSVFILTIGLGIAVFAKEIILLITSNKSYFEAYKVIPIITLAYIFEGFYYMAINSVFYAKKTHLLAITTGLTAVLDILLNYLLIPPYGIYGAAIATAGAYLFLFILTYIIAQRYYYIKWNWNSILINFVLCLLAYEVATLGSRGILGSFILKILVFIIYIIILFIFKILSIPKLLYIGKKLFKR